MPAVQVNAKRFEGHYVGLNGEHRIKISRRAILGAVLTLGFQRFDDLRSAGGREWGRRVAKGISALCMLRGDGDHLRIDDGFEGLDMSEKGTESYSLGMIFAKIVADRLLGVRWLGHVDEMKRRGILHTDESTNERGDMAGLCQNRRWHVVEAKGRSNPFPDRLVEDSKRQAARVTEVNGASPTTTSACITSLWPNPIEVILDDPPPEGEVWWEISEEGLWKYYYNGLARYIREASTSISVKALDEHFSFAPISPIVETLPIELQRALAPLPEFVGLPKRIVDEPSIGAFLFEEQWPEVGVRVESDGLVLLGPFEERSLEISRKA